jgi:hypothetical protein
MYSIQLIKKTITSIAFECLLRCIWVRNVNIFSFDESHKKKKGKIENKKSIMTKANNR